IYGARQPDAFDSNGSNNNTYLTATNLNAFINGNAQVAIGGLDLTTPSDADWFTVTAPSAITGAMTVTVQSSNLSSFAPRLHLYTASRGLVGQVAAPNTFGATISLSVPGVHAGQRFYFKVLAAGGPALIGGYGLLANFGAQSQSPIPPPSTVVPEQAD